MLPSSASELEPNSQRLLSPVTTSIWRGAVHHERSPERRHRRVRNARRNRRVAEAPARSASGRSRSRVDSLASQVLQLRTEMRDGFSAIEGRMATKAGTSADGHEGRPRGDGRQSTTSRGWPRKTTSRNSEASCAKRCQAQCVRWRGSSSPRSGGSWNESRCWSRTSCRGSRSGTKGTPERPDQKIVLTDAAARSMTRVGRMPR